MIPTFPKFKSLELSDRAEVERFTSRHPPYSDYNFTSLWCWDIYDRVLLSKLDGHLIVQFTDDTTAEPFYSFFGSNTEFSAKLADKVFSKMEHDGLKPALRLVPENMIGVLDHGRFHIEDDPDNHDYIISLEKIMTFQGNAFQRHRYLSNCFKKQYLNAQIVEFDVGDKFTHRMIERVSATWQQNKGYSVNHEQKALKRLFQIDHMQAPNYYGLYIKNDLVAFHVVETLCNNYAIGHFMKADTRLKGVYSFLLQAMAKSIFERGFRFLNIEQDLGIPGLRMAKTALRPIYYLKKYTVSKILNSKQ